MILALILVFGILLCLGLPIAFTLGITALVMIALYSPAPLMMLPEVMYNALDTFPLMAIPFFVIAATFMVRGGTSRYLINAADCYVRHVWGGLAVVSVVSCMIFGAICGSSVATALAIGVIIIPAMMRFGYPRSFAMGVVGAAGTVAIMIPPSIAMIIYGIMADESIPRLFLAGVMPGIMQGVFYILWILFHARRKKLGGAPKASWEETLSSTVKALPALSMPFIILGGIYSGFVTVTEAAAMGAVVAILISLYVYREVKHRQVLSITTDAMKSAGMVMFIISTAIVFGNWLTEAGLPARLVEMAREMHLSPLVFLLFVNIILLVLGMFLEVVSVMLITLPIILPVINILGIDLIHFGIIMTVNMEVALITPPVGLNLYVISGVARAPLAETIRGVFPFMIISIIQLAIITYWPAYTLFLPNLLMPR
ncbi:MAG: TRAP transporter large permease [Deltaproteobacteria bacterium]|nr:TRAP transporter large permease [Deltaproteobacteria bacterium]